MWGHGSLYIVTICTLTCCKAAASSVNLFIWFWWNWIWRDWTELCLIPGLFSIECIPAVKAAEPEPEGSFTWSHLHLMFLSIKVMVKHVSANVWKQLKQCRLFDLFTCRKPLIYTYSTQSQRALHIKGATLAAEAAFSLIHLLFQSACWWQVLRRHTESGSVTSFLSAASPDFVCPCLACSIKQCCSFGSRWWLVSLFLSAVSKRGYIFSHALPGRWSDTHTNTLRENKKTKQGRAGWENELPVVLDP